MWDLVYVVGRVALVAIFIKSGVDKLIDPTWLTGVLSAKAFPTPKVLAYAAGLVEVVLGVLVAVGWQARIAAFGLFAFTIVATLIAHNFWDMSGPARAANTIQFWKNASILGGLLMLMASGPGRYAISRR
ncbi:MAG TPA: DoxX family protein [Beijerinckiaceae bacterium]|jgi:putative oxidoreductase